MSKILLTVALIFTLMFTSFLYAGGCITLDAWIDGNEIDYDADLAYTDATDVYFWVYVSVSGTGDGYAQARAGTEGGGMGWAITETSQGGTYWDYRYHDSFGDVRGNVLACGFEEGASAEAEVEIEWE